MCAELGGEREFYLINEGIMGLDGYKKDKQEGEIYLFHYLATHKEAKIIFAAHQPNSSSRSF